MDWQHAQTRRGLRHSIALVVTTAALAGCGGDSSEQAAAPVSTATTSDGAGIQADGTRGLVGPAQRATAERTEVTGRRGAIPRSADQPTDGQRHGVAAGAACGDSAVLPTDSNLEQVAASVICLLNGERADAGLPGLARNAQLDAASRDMSNRMVTQRFFAHTTPDGLGLVDRVRPTGYLPRSDEWVVGENLAWGSGALSTPQAIVNGWMGSPGHKANVLAPDFRDIGIGIVIGSPSGTHSGGATFTTVFGARGSVPADGPSAASGPSGAETVTVPATLRGPLRRALRRGVSYSARCARACALVGRLYVDARRARAARLGSRRTAVATGRLTLRSAGAGRLTVRMTARARRALRTRRSLRLTLVTTDRSTGATRSTRVTLR